MLQLLQSLLMDLKEYHIGVAAVRWPQDESVMYVLAQSAVGQDFTPKPKAALFNSRFITTWQNQVGHARGPIGRCYRYINKRLRETVIPLFVHAQRSLIHKNNFAQLTNCMLPAHPNGPR